MGAMGDSKHRQAFLYILSGAQAFAFAAWAAMLKNFSVEVVGVDGLQNAILETVREIPGFLAFTTVFFLAYMREQKLALFSILILGIGIAVTGFFSSLTLLLLATFVNSIGFHFYHTVYKSLSLQWFDERTTPIILGRVLSVGNAATVVALGFFMLLFWVFHATYALGYFIAGMVAIVGAIYAWAALPIFPKSTNQRQEFVLRWPYKLYYILTFLSGARRQIFIVFATFILVDVFGLTIVQMLLLLLINAFANMGTGLVLGPAINKFGERVILQIEYLGLFFVFLAYGWALAHAGESWALPLVIGLYILDHILFQFAIGIESYFKKIADPRDLAGSAAVSFSINHIAAVTLPIVLGLVYIQTPDLGTGGPGLISVGGPTLVFWVGAILAAISFVMTCFMDLNPKRLSFPTTHKSHTSFH